MGAQHMFLILAAVCSGVKNNSAVGLFVQPESASIGYGQNISIVCSQQNRPGNFFFNLIFFK